MIQKEGLDKSKITDKIVGIVVDRTKLMSENIKNKGYMGDIVNITFPINSLPSIGEIKKAKDPYKYHYNYIYKTDTNFPLYKALENAKIIHFAKCPYQRENGLIDKNTELIMISEVAKSWDVYDNIGLAEKFPFSNPKAILINKKHKVWGNAIFLLIDTKNEKYINLDVPGFREIYKKSIITGKKNVLFISDLKKRLNKKMQDIDTFKMKIYDEVMRRFYQRMNLIVNDKKLSDGIDNLSWNIIWSTDIDIKDEKILKKFDHVFKKYPVEEIIKKKKEVLDDLMKEEDKKAEEELKKLNKELEDIKKIKFTKEERRLHALKFLSYLISNNIVTLEDAYIIFSAQLNNQYVISGKPWFESGAYFHPLDEFENLMLSIDDGVSYENLSNDPSELKYFTEKSNNIIK
jgi:hypothetical protein